MVSMQPMLQLPRLFFDFGAVRSLPQQIAALGIEHPLVVSDQGLVRAGVVHRIRDILERSRQAYAIFDSVPENPTFDGADRARTAYRTGNCDGLLAVGGGSVIDTAKVLAATLGRQSTAEFFAEGAKVDAPIAPLIAVPTTAGTGSEASPDAGIHPDAMSASVGISSPYVVPRIAICDPDLTLSLPPRLVAATGIDALSHCIEGYLSTTVSPPAEAMALDGIRRVSRHLAGATETGAAADRWQIMMAAFEGGAAIAMGLGPAHAIAIACGDQGLHHGLLSGLGLLASLPVLARHAPGKVEDIARTLDLPAGRAVASEVARLMLSLGLPTTLSGAGYRFRDLDALAAACAASHFNLTSPYRPDKSEFAVMIGSILG